MASTIEKKEHSQVVISLEASKEEWNEALRRLTTRTRTVSRFPASVRARFLISSFASITERAFFMRTL